MAAVALAWDIPNMKSKTEKKADAERSAAEIAERLIPLRPGDMSEKQWTRKAQVSPSFFSNLRGTPSKPPSDPGVSQLRRILTVAGVTLPEFFVHEAAGRLCPPPTVQALERALSDALAELPRRAADRPAYLATIVQRVLELPEGTPTIRATGETPGEDDSEGAVPPLVSTNRA